MINFWFARAQRIKVMSCAIALSVFSAGAVTGCASIQRTDPGATYGVPATQRTVAQRILDQSIVNTARLNINALDETLPKRSRIGIDSFYSHLLLTGEVPDQQIKSDIMNIVSSMPDVKEVHDGLTVGPSKGLSYTIHDGYITSKLNAKILANESIQTSQLKVVTDDGIVYVLGKLTPTQRGHLMSIVESTEGIKELVLLTELIDDSGAVLDEANVSQETGLAAPTYVPENYDQYAMSDESLGQAPVTLPVVSTEVTQPDSQQTANAMPLRQSSADYAPPQTQPIQNAPSESEYINLYKEDVPGWK